MRFYLFTTLLIGMMIVLAAGGFNLPVTGGLMKAFGMMDDSGKNATIEDFKSSEYWDDTNSGKDKTQWFSLKNLLTVLVVAGAVAGFIGRSPDIRYLTGTLVFLLAGAILTDYISIWLQLKSYGIGWLTWGGLFIFGTLIGGFFITAIEFWQGTD